MSSYSEQVLAHFAKYGPEVHLPAGTQTRSTTRTTTREIKSATKDMEDVITGPIARLLGIQTGVNGFVLKSLKSISGAAGAASKVIEVSDSEGNTLYIDASTSYS